jgi:hypothetical protein
MIQIKDFTNYSISRDGIVVNMVSGRVVKARVDNKGYLRVILRRDKLYARRVHRLLAVAFIPNPGNKKQINHKDGNKLNNSLENLEWCTLVENVKHAYATGLMFTGKVPFRKDKKLDEHKVREIKALSNTISKAELSRRYGVCPSVIGRIVSGDAWAHVV